MPQPGYFLTLHSIGGDLCIYSGGYLEPSPGPGRPKVWQNGSQSKEAIGEASPTLRLLYLFLHRHMQVHARAQRPTADSYTQVQCLQPPVVLTLALLQRQISVNCVETGHAEPFARWRV